jgi:hypothetical protein
MDLSPSWAALLSVIWMKIRYFVAIAVFVTLSLFMGKMTIYLKVPSLWGLQDSEE